MYKVKNAIILAAGRGARLKELTKVTPKPLLAPKGIKFIDGIISKLKEKNINEIYVVTGYLSEQFNYLKKQGIKLIHNKNWNKGNNVTSINAALNFISNSLIINGDIILEKNVFKNQYPYSLTYVEKNKNIDEWIIEVDKNQQVISIDKDGKNKSGFYQREIIFINSVLAKSIKKYISDFDKNEYQEFLVLKSSKQTDEYFGIYQVPKDIVYDLDTVVEYNEYKNN